MDSDQTEEGFLSFRLFGSGGIIQIQIYHQESAVSSELRFCPTVWPTVSSLASYELFYYFFQLQRCPRKGQQKQIYSHHQGS